MNLDHVFGHGDSDHAELPSIVRSVEDVGGVRIVRIDGPVGKRAGDELSEYRKQHKQYTDFSRPLLLDFKNATECDFTTVAFLIAALRERMKAHAGVGIINAPRELVAELELAQLEGVFPVFDNEQEAIEKLASHT